MAISQNALARAVGVPPRRINEIVLGKRAVTVDTDLRLARYFGVSEGFFLGLQSDYDLMERRREIGSDLDAIEPFAVFAEVQDEDPQGAFFDRIVDDEVLRAIDQLPEAFRETLVLSDVEGMSYQEIAQILEVPIGTVKSRLFRARQMLQGKLYNYAVEMGYIKGTPA